MSQATRFYPWVADWRAAPACRSHTYVAASASRRRLSIDPLARNPSPTTSPTTVGQFNSASAWSRSDGRTNR